MHLLNLKNTLIAVSISSVILAFVLYQINFSNSNTESQYRTQQTSPSEDRQSAVSDSTNEDFVDAPDFTLETMDGEQFTLSDHLGKVVVLNIWATWCPPCRKEIPDFIELQEEMEDDGVLFVGVSVDKEGWEVVKPFAKEFDINYPLVVDDGTVRELYGPYRGIPTTFFINKKGQVEYVTPGMVTKDILEPILVELHSK